MIQKIVAYWKDVVKEMRKVSWPTREQLIESTVVVTVASVIVSLFIFGADQIISWILQQIY